MVDNAKVIKTDIVADNGVIHVTEVKMKLRRSLSKVAMGRAGARNRRRPPTRVLPVGS